MVERTRYSMSDGVVEGGSQFCPAVAGSTVWLTRGRRKVYCQCDWLPFESTLTRTVQSLP